MRTWIAAVSTLALIALLLSCGLDNNCVMKIGSQKLSVKDAVKIYEMSQEARRPGKVTEADAKEFCISRFSREMYYLEEAKNLGIVDEDSIREKILEQKKKILTRDRGLLYTEIVKSVKDPTSDDLHKLYEKRHWEYKLAHILLPSPQLADSVYGLLKKGQSFERLVAQFSFDRRFADKKGVWLDWFLYGIMGGDFDDTVIKLLPGIPSRPIHTRYGYHIIRVLKKRERKQLPFQQVIPWLRATYFGMERERAMFHYKNSLPQKYHFKMDSAVALIIRNAYTEDEKGLPTLDAGKIKDALPLTLASFNGGKLTVKGFAKYYNSQRPLLLPPLKRLDAIEDFAKRAAMVDLMYLDAQSRGLDKDPEYQNQVWLFAKRLYTTECQKRIARPIEISDIEVRQRYDADSTYQKQSFEEAERWIRRAIRTEKMNAENERQLNYLREKYAIKFCSRGLKRLMQSMQEIKAKKSAQHPKKGK